MIATFFGGGQKDTNSIEYSESIIIGEILVSKKYEVRNGGYYGLMEAVSKGVYNKNGIVKGYTCKTFKYIKGNKYLSETIICEDIYERLRYLISESNIFIIQKGGIGTMSEICLLLDEVRKMENYPKIIFVSDMWKPIIDSMNTIIEIDKLIFCKTNDIINYI